jgi:hypothetical protein
MIRGDAIDVAAISLEFLQLLRARIISIRAPAHVELRVIGRKVNFRLVTGTAASANDAMTRDAFVGGRRRRREAPLQIALSGGELTERADGHLVLERWVAAIISRIGRPVMRHKS